MARFVRKGVYGKLVRTYKRLTLPKNMKHMMRTFPWLHMEPVGDCFDVFWKGQKVNRTLSWNQLKADFNANEIYVIGSGPSMHEQQLERLKGKKCILLNGAIKLVEKGLTPEPIMFMAEDYRFVIERAELLNRLPDTVPLALVAPAMQALGEYCPSLMRNNPLYLIDAVISPYGKPSTPLSAYPDEDYLANGGHMLSLNMANGHFGCGTVMYSGVQAALFLRPKRINLVGFDLTNFEQPRINEQTGDVAWTGLANAYEKRILPAFRLVRQACDARGIEIRNLSHTSIVPRELLPFDDQLMP